MIPLDLIHDILSRLPAKSVVRFRCVSKLWSSITTRQDFITSFATQSSTRMCLLVGGLICFGDIGGNIVVWNRTMRQHVTLPKPEPKVGCVCSFLGYDPVEDTSQAPYSKILLFLHWDLQNHGEWPKIALNISIYAPQNE